MHTSFPSINFRSSSSVSSNSSLASPRSQATPTAWDGASCSRHVTKAEGVAKGSASGMDAHISHRRLPSTDSGIQADSGWWDSLTRSSRDSSFGKVLAESPVSPDGSGLQRTLWPSGLPPEGFQIPATSQQSSYDVRSATTYDVRTTSESTSIPRHNDVVQATVKTGIETVPAASNSRLINIEVRGQTSEHRGQTSQQRGQTPPVNGGERNVVRTPAWRSDSLMSKSMDSGLQSELRRPTVVSITDVGQLSVRPQQLSSNSEEQFQPWLTQSESRAVYTMPRLTKQRMPSGPEQLEVSSDFDPSCTFVNSRSPVSPRMTSSLLLSSPIKSSVPFLRTSSMEGKISSPLSLLTSSTLVIPTTRSTQGTVLAGSTQDGNWGQDRRETFSLQRELDQPFVVRGVDLSQRRAPPTSAVSRGVSHSEGSDITRQNGSFQQVGYSGIEDSLQDSPDSPSVPVRVVSVPSTVSVTERMSSHPFSNVAQPSTKGHTAPPRPNTLSCQTSLDTQSHHHQHVTPNSATPPSASQSSKGGETPSRFSVTAIRPVIVKPSPQLHGNQNCLSPRLKNSQQGLPGSTTNVTSLSPRPRNVTPVFRSKLSPIMPRNFQRMRVIPVKSSAPSTANSQTISVPGPSPSVINFKRIGNAATPSPSSAEDSASPRAANYSKRPIAATHLAVSANHKPIPVVADSAPSPSPRMQPIPVLHVDTRRHVTNLKRNTSALSPNHGNAVIRSVLAHHRGRGGGGGGRGSGASERTNGVEHEDVDDASSDGMWELLQLSAAAAVGARAVVGRGGGETADGGGGDVEGGGGKGGDGGRGVVRTVPIVDVRKEVPWTERRKRMDSALCWLRGELESLRAMDTELMTQFQRCQDSIESLKQQQQLQQQEEDDDLSWGWEGSDWGYGWGLSGSEFGEEEEEEAWEDWEIAEFEKKWAQCADAKELDIIVLPARPAARATPCHRDVNVNDVRGSDASSRQEKSPSPFTQDLEATV